MKCRRIVLAILCVALLGACSDTETMTVKHDQCYRRQSFRMFGLQIEANQTAHKMKDCHE